MSTALRFRIYEPEFDGADALSDGEDNDVLYGGTGADGLSGGAFTENGQNELYSGPGSDTINAESTVTFDEVYGGSGDDTIYAEDNLADVIDCGYFANPNTSAPDTDTVYADRTSNGDPINDTVVDCETVN